MKNQSVLVRFICFGMLILINGNLFSQNKTVLFQIPAPVQKIKESLFSSVVFIDSRVDSMHMGYVKVGLLDTKAGVIMNPSLAVQLSKLLSEATNAVTGGETLYFRVRNLFFKELTETFDSKGSCHFRATLFTKSKDRFYKVNEIDTLVLVKSMDATKSLLKNAGNAVVDFMLTNLNRKSNDSIGCTYAEMLNPDSADKSKLKLYTALNYNEGLYSSYKSFSDQIPDNQIQVEEKKGKIKDVKVKDSLGNLAEIQRNEIYAIVYKGTPYVSTPLGYYELTKRNNNFYFIGKMKKEEANPDMGALFGIAGSLISQSATGVYEMKLDHHFGRFIQIRAL